jgi:hypothetical protein
MRRRKRRRRRRNDGERNEMGKEIEKRGHFVIPADHLPSLFSSASIMTPDGTSVSSEYLHSSVQEEAGKVPHGSARRPCSGLERQRPALSEFVVPPGH